jgi:hypothetical protein
MILLVSRYITHYKRCFSITTHPVNLTNKNSTKGSLYDSNITIAAAD